MFDIVCVDDPSERMPGGDNPADANAKARTVAQATGKRWRIERAAPTQAAIDAGIAREVARFDSGEYVPVPDWFPTLPQHYAHRSTRDDKASTHVAYSRDSHDLAEDRQASLGASRYLSTFFPDMPAHEIALMARRYEVGDAPNTLEFTRDPARVVSAYADYEHCSQSSGYRSCMAYPAGYFGLRDDRHPAVAYVGPNSTLSVALLYPEGKPDQILARAVVMPERKAFVRVYGINETACTAIEDALVDAGYKRCGSYAGERIHLYEHPYVGFIVPYVDGSCQTCDWSGYLCDDGEIDCSTTSGHAESYPMARCDHCGDRVPYDETHRVVGELWCTSCYENEAATCDYCGETFGDSDALQEVRIASRRYGIGNAAGHASWCRDCVDTCAFTCERLDEVFSYRDFSPVDVRVDASGLTAVWCQEVADNAGEIATDDDGDMISAALARELAAANAEAAEDDAAEPATDLPPVRCPETHDLFSIDNPATWSA